MTLPVAAPAHHLDRACAHPRDDTADVRSAPQNPARLLARDDGVLGDLADGPCHDLLTVEDWISAVHSSRDLPDLVDRLGHSPARLAATATVVFPWDGELSALGAAAGFVAGEPLALVALGD